MSGITEKQMVVIGGLVNTADVHAKKVLASYKPAVSYAQNMVQLKKCNSAQLESCAKLVKLAVRTEDGKETKLYKNKSVLADRIILKIESLFEATCSDCNAVYQNTLESAPPFTCRLCLLGSHNCEEITKRAENVGSPTPAGFVWLCHVCLGKNDLEDMGFPVEEPESKNSRSESLHVIEEEEENEEDKEEEEGEAAEDNTSGDRVSPRRGRAHEPKGNQRAENRNQSKDNAICELYKRRSCPHGRSGKLKVEGQICQKSHPKRCFRFCDYGPRHRNGCNKGSKCQYWHPKLCKFSLKGTGCTTHGCTYQHLIADRQSQRQNPPVQHKTPAKRFVKENLVIEAPLTAHNGEQTWMPEHHKVSIASSIGKTPYPATVNKPFKQKKAHEDQESFLLKLIENMRAGIQEQLYELKCEFRDSIHQMENQTKTENPSLAPRVFPGCFQPVNMQTMVPPGQTWLNQAQGYPFQALSS